MLWQKLRTWALEPPTFWFRSVTKPTENWSFSLRGEMWNICHESGKKRKKKVPFNGKWGIELRPISTSKSDAQQSELQLLYISTISNVESTLSRYGTKMNGKSSTQMSNWESWWWLMIKWRVLKTERNGPRFWTHISRNKTYVSQRYIGKAELPYTHLGSWRKEITNQK